MIYTHDVIVTETHVKSYLDMEAIEMQSVASHVSPHHDRDFQSPLDVSDPDQTPPQWAQPDPDERFRYSFESTKRHIDGVSNHEFESRSPSIEHVSTSPSTSAKNRPTTQRRKRWIPFDWWEERVSIFVSLICTSLAVGVLFYMNGRSMQDWKLAIQPNSLIAIFATLTRAALIFPLAECIGQLKWVHFETPRPLSLMESFDMASRGPLGAAKFIWHARVTSPLASCAAFAIILLLAFQPFMQQVVDFSTRMVPMSNETAFATITTTWLYSDALDMVSERSSVDSCKSPSLMIHWAKVS